MLALSRQPNMKTLSSFFGALAWIQAVWSLQSLQGDTGWCEGRFRCMTTACRLLWLWVVHEEVGYSPVEGGACAVVGALGHLFSGSSSTKPDQEPVRSVQSGLWAAQDAENRSFQADSWDLQLLQSLAFPASPLWALG